MLKHKLRVGVDVDDVLYSCVDYVCQCINNDHKVVPPIKATDFSDWSHCSNPHYKLMYNYFKSPEFSYNQPILPGAKEFMAKLKDMCEVFIVSAVNHECMSVRASRIIADFNISPDHIILGSRKDLIELDVMLDDAAHNILDSKATFPILFRRPWNQYLTGVLSVNNYDEVLEIIKTIEHQIDPPKHPDLVCLVGPSGSNKNLMAKNLKELGHVDLLLSTTTRPKYENEIENETYEYITHDEYEELLHNEQFLERSIYANYHYGIRTSRIEQFMSSHNKIGLVCLDICGAMRLKSLYGNKVVLVFVKKDKKTLIENILNKNTNINDYVNRILAIETENKNRWLCDYLIENQEQLIDLILKFKS